MISDTLRQLAAGVTALLSPPRCLVCGLSLQRETLAPSCLTGDGSPGEAAPLLCPDCAAALPTIEEPICEQCGKPLISEERLCLRCREIEDAALLGTRALYQYRRGAMALLHGLKERGDQRVAALLAGEIRRRRLIPPGTDLIVPIPSSRRGRRRRGFDQARLLARELSRLTGIPTAPLLHRRGGGEQKRLDREGRLANVSGRLTLRPGARRRLSAARRPEDPEDGTPQSPTNAPRRILLLDDVTTTGATLEAAARVLRDSGAAVTVYAVVVAVD